MRKLAIIVPLLLLLAGASWWAVKLWNSVGDTAIPASGYIALALGVIFSLVIGCGLMALMFYSSRHGYDDAAQGKLPPEGGGPSAP